MAPDYNFAGWMVGTPQDVSGFEAMEGDVLYPAGYQYTIENNMSFIARYRDDWEGQGSGTVNDPFLISTVADLEQLANRVNNEHRTYKNTYFLMTNDIVFDGTENNHTAIGHFTNVNDAVYFDGTFNGNGHSISGININQSSNHQGIFGAIGANGTVMNLTIKNSFIKGSNDVGSIAGWNEGKVSHCLSINNVVQGHDCVGSIIGMNIGKAIFNYYTTGNLGGIGYNYLNSVNIYGGNKGYTISCTNGLTFAYIKGIVSGSNEDAIIEYDDNLYAAAGITISFKVDAPLGYSIESLTCNGTTITPNDEGVYTFTMPETNVSINSELLQPTFIIEGNWEDAENWSNGLLPYDGSDVVIAAPATIETTANVGYITFRDNGSITIADGGELAHLEDRIVTLQKEIEAYTNDSDGWYTIASPVTWYYPTTELATGEYDLYLYYEPTHYWWNSKAHDITNLKNGTGYLYANAEHKTLSFTGLTAGTHQTINIPLIVTDAAGELKGFNLVGNPFTCRLTDEDAIKIGNDDLTTYLVADGGGELVAYTLAEREIEPGEGFFVQATAVPQDLVINSATREEQPKTQPAYLRIEAGKEGAYDRAYVQIGSGNTLRKMNLKDNTLKVSVQHDGKDWAAATIESTTGELPVNFKAIEDGTYTITVNPKNVELSYLHLIDNLTGADVDLLPLCKGGRGDSTTQPAYTFTAKTTDYESRFRLVFSVCEDADGDNDAFAFVSNGNIIVNGEGTLQIIDVMGRVIISVDGRTRCVPTAGMARGVYVLRLVNGNDVKVQKMVIDR